ncbi:hypothetical protein YASMINEVIRUS_646, partial [Yasminevirus sp. GU-2018]
LKTEITEIDNTTIESMRKCCATVQRLLTLAHMMTKHVYIVTNSDIGWVEASTNKFYPELVTHEYFLKTKILSTKSFYESVYPGLPMRWKLSTMTDILLEVVIDDSSRENKRNNRLMRRVSWSKVKPHDATSDIAVKNKLTTDPIHLVGVGDTLTDRDALFLSGRDFKCCTKSIKTVDRPTIETLTSQIDLIANMFPYIVSYEGVLDMQTTITQTN